MKLTMCDKCKGIGQRLAHYELTDSMDSVNFVASVTLVGSFDLCDDCRKALTDWLNVKPQDKQQEEQPGQICGATNLPCSHCQPGPCGSRKEQYE